MKLKLGGVAAMDSCHSIPSCNASIDSSVISAISIVLFSLCCVVVSRCTMAEGGDAEWELSKENIQPLKRGRDVSVLHQVLSQQQDGPSSAVSQQKQ